MTIEEREDAIKFFKEVAEKEVNNAKYSRLAIEELERGLSSASSFECDKEYSVLSYLKVYHDGKKDALNKIRAEIEKNTSRYTISRERGAMGQVEWSDKLIKESEVLEIIDKYLLEVSE